MRSQPAPERSPAATSGAAGTDATGADALPPPSSSTAELAALVARSSGDAAAAETTAPVGGVVTAEPGAGTVTTTTDNGDRTDTSELPTTDLAQAPLYDDDLFPDEHGFTPTLVIVALLATMLVGIGVFARVIRVTTSIEVAGVDTGDWMVNDFGTNNTVAALIAAGIMVIGGLLAGLRRRWGAGLAGGAGLALAGWAALLLGLAELQLAAIRSASHVPSGQPYTLTITHDLGYWLILAAGIIGGLLFLASLFDAGDDGRVGLDPWLGAAAAVAAVVAAAGPLIPVAQAELSDNWSTPAGSSVDLPTMYFAGRLIQLGLVAFAGVVGFLMVRRYGLGLGIGGFVVFGWMWATAALDLTDSPIGPGVVNPGTIDVDPHTVTTIGAIAFTVLALAAVVTSVVQHYRYR